MKSLTIVLFFTCMLPGFCIFANSSPYRPEGMQDSIPSNILIINSFDAMSIKGTKNKKELFAKLADSLKQLLYDRVKVQYQVQAIIIPGILHETANSDSVLFSMMASNNSYTAIVIKKIDVYFNLNNVEVTGVKNDKTRTAAYTLCADITYNLYSGTSDLKVSPTNICEFYSNRNVVSGMLAVGPDIVGKRKDAFKIIAKNAEKYLWQAF